MKLFRTTSDRPDNRIVETSEKLICDHVINYHLDEGNDGFELRLTAGTEQPFYELRLSAEETKLLRDVLAKADPS